MQHEIDVHLTHVLEATEGLTCESEISLLSDMNNLLVCLKDSTLPDKE